MAGFREAHHLPNRRPDRAPADPEGLPRQRRGTTPQMHGRYPDFDVLEEAGHWDDATRRLVLARVESPPPRRFFDETESASLAAFCDTVLDQDGEPRVPVLAYIDEKLWAGRLDGYRYADMPDDREAWRLLARALDAEARKRNWETFAELDPDLRVAVCGDLAEGRLRGDPWDEIPRIWEVALRMVLAAFYAHPWAWNEIGFGGPAYPRGYMRLGVGRNEPWEGKEAVGLDPVTDVKRRGLE